jgi:hypothetical protein
VPVVMSQRVAVRANIWPACDALVKSFASLQDFHGANAFWILSKFNEFHIGSKRHGAGVRIAGTAVRANEEFS